MGRHSMKQKKPGVVLSVGPRWMKNAKWYIGGDDGTPKGTYEPQEGPNRHTRRVTAKLFRKRESASWVSGRI